MKKIILFIVVLIAIPNILFSSGRGKLVFSSSIGKGKWPLKSNFARVYCKRIGFGSKAIYLSTSFSGSDKVYWYAVNGTARGAMKKLGLSDIAPIMKKDKIPADLQLFIEVGLKECN